MRRRPSPPPDCQAPASSVADRPSGLRLLARPGLPPRPAPCRLSRAAAQAVPAWQGTASRMRRRPARQAGSSGRQTTRPPRRPTPDGVAYRAGRPAPQIGRPYSMLTRMRSTCLAPRSVAATWIGGRPPSKEYGSLSQVPALGHPQGHDWRRGSSRAARKKAVPEGTAKFREETSKKQTMRRTALLRCTN
jgi:hypothetical protein